MAYFQTIQFRTQFKLEIIIKIICLKKIINTEIHSLLFLRFCSVLLRNVLFHGRLALISADRIKINSVFLSYYRKSHLTQLTFERNRRLELLDMVL